MKKTAFELVSGALEELEKLKPTPEEIQDYADLNQDTYSVVTYSKSKGATFTSSVCMILGNKNLAEGFILTSGTLMKSLLMSGTFVIRLI